MNPETRHTTPRTPKIGLLPFFLHLYENICSQEELDEVKAFADVIRVEYEKRGVEVVLVESCCKQAQFEAAIHTFEQADVDAIVTLHLAYSPSLESIDALAATSLPLIILDTTPDFAFGFEQESERIMFNHGIHGVQDFCNLLLRHDKAFSLEAGHWKQSDVLDRTIALIKGSQAAALLTRARVGIVGTPFKGMGDFAIPFDVLKREIGMEVISADSESVGHLMPAPDSPEVKDEIEKDLAAFRKGTCSDAALRASEVSGLGLRRWMEQEKLSAVTVNFGDITGPPGLPVMPFLELSKAMARGIGYGGEGDVLTAAFCGALGQVVPETTFTEMFCPDWEGNRIFMSHMGEVSTALTAQTPVLEQRPYPFSAADEPVIAAGCLRSGAAWLLNVAPGKDDTFTLVSLPVEVCDTDGNEKIAGGVRGWIKTGLSTPDLLKQYSLHGGTHHSVLCYGVDEAFVQAFASAMQWKSVVIG